MALVESLGSAEARSVVVIGLESPVPLFPSAPFSVLALSRFRFGGSYGERFANMAKSRALAAGDARTWLRRHEHPPSRQRGMGGGTTQVPTARIAANEDVGGSGRACMTMQRERRVSDELVIDGPPFWFLRPRAASHPPSDAVSGTDPSRDRHVFHDAVWKIFAT